MNNIIQIKRGAISVATGLETPLAYGELAYNTTEQWLAIGNQSGKAIKIPYLSNAAAGNATKGVYIDSNGNAVAMTYAVNKDVPSDAKFTDTTYGEATTAAAGLMSAADKTKLNGITAGATAVTTTTVKNWGYGTYSKPSGGIPKTDLASAVQTSLGKADTALQSVGSSTTYYTTAYINKLYVKNGTALQSNADNTTDKNNTPFTIDGSASITVSSKGKANVSALVSAAYMSKNGDLGYIHRCTVSPYRAIGFGVGGGGINRGIYDLGSGGWIFRAGNSSEDTANHVYVGDMPYATNLSDRDLKQNINYFGSIKDLYMDLKPCTYKYKPNSFIFGTDLQSGLIAQDVLQAFEKHNIDQSVFNIVDRDRITPKQGQYIKDRDYFYYMNYTGLHALHIKFGQEIYKELSEKISQLEERIRELEEKN